MMKNSTYIIEATVTAVSNLAVSPPRPKSEKMLDNDKTSRLPRRTDGNGIEIVYFPASSIRGKLRRVSETLIREAIQGDGDPVFELDDIYYNRIGGVKDKGSEDKVDIVTAHKLRQSNPLIGLYGSMVSHTAGRVSIGDAVPISYVKPAIIGGVRCDDFERNPELLSILTPSEVDRWLNLAEAGAAASARKAESKAIASRLAKARSSSRDEDAADAKETLKKLQDEIKEDSVNIKQPLAGYEALPAGTKMNCRIVLHNVSQLMAGLFVATLREFSLFPQVGAHFNHGCGIIQIDMVVKAQRSSSPIGSMSTDPFVGINIDCQSLSDAVALFDQHMSSGFSGFDFKAPAAARLKSA